MTTWFTSAALIVLFPLLINLAEATVTAPFSTSHVFTSGNNCTEQDQTSGFWVNCDGLNAYGGWCIGGTSPSACVKNGGKVEQITTAANYSGGGGGRGQRHWIANGKNANTGSMSVTVSNVTNEVYVRWYTRWQSGYIMTGNGQKLLYFDQCYILLAASDYRWNCNGVNNVQTAGGWNQLYPAGTHQSDGAWHWMELHANRTTGVVQLWIDGALRVNASGVTFNCGGTCTLNHWKYPENAEADTTACAGSVCFQDVDDIAIQTTGPIGPLGGGDTTVPTATISSPADDPHDNGSTSTVNVSGSASDNVGVSSVTWACSTCTPASGTATGTTSWSVSSIGLASGNNLITVTAHDAAGNVGSDSVTVSYAPADSTVPSVSINTPQTPTSVTPITITGSATDNVAVSSISWVNDQGYQGTATCTGCPGASVTWSASIPLDIGGNIITVTATDSSTNTNTAQTTVDYTVNATVLFSESFDDGNLPQRGWYDSPTMAIDTSIKHTGAGSVRCTWQTSATNCDNNVIGRHMFTPTSTLYVSYWVRYEAGYVGSGQSFHPHEFYFLTTADCPTNQSQCFSGLAFNYLDLYIQQSVGTNGGVPQIEIQDGRMVDQNQINVDLAGSTESRSVASCNGVHNTGGSTVETIFGGADCYCSFNTGSGCPPSVYWNEYAWNAATGRFTTDTWQHVEVYVALNSINGGIGQQDGIIKYWLDGTLIINISNAILRTGANPTMQFNHLALFPYIGNGSPQQQSFWIDDLVIATAPLLAAPSNLTITRRRTQ